jgi:outer membrane protein|tara:strand:+ start:301 stop:855 length:555 start_codon:yes stop_codon:yes gene_type:complete
MLKYSRLLIVFVFLGLNTISYSQKVAVVDVQKVFDGYQKVKDARERLDKSKKIAMEELEIYRAELGKIVTVLKDMESKLKNPNIESSSLKLQYQQKVKEAKEKQDDMIAYDKRAKSTIAQRQRNLLIEHLADIRTAVQKVAGAKGFDMVLNSSQTQLGVFYAGDKFDVTEEVIVTLNALGAKKN